MTTGICSFCGTRRDQVETLVHNGPVFICNECMDATKKDHVGLRDWSRITVKGVEFNWCEFTSVVPTESATWKPVVVISVHRVGETDGVGRILPENTVPTESHAIELIEQFTERYGLR